MSSYYPADAGRNLSTSRTMWSSAAVNSDSGSDNDFTKGKKRKPADNLLERIQKRLQNENFYDLNTSDEIGAPSPGHSGDASSYGRPRPQGYVNQDSSAMMRQQSGIVVPQAPSPPIISMQGEASAQSLSHAAHGSYAHQEMYKSDSRSQQQLGGNMFNYESAGATKQEASSRFGPPAKKPRTEAVSLDFSSAGGSGYPPSLSDFLAENFGVPADDLPLPYDKTQHLTTAKEGAMLSVPAKFFSSKKSKFSSMDSDGRSATPNAESYYSRDSSRVSASDQHRNSPLVDGRSSGSGIFVPARDRGGFSDSNQSAAENAQNFVAHHQSSRSSQNRQSYQFQGSASHSKSSLDPNFSSQKSISSDDIGGTSVWGAQDSLVQSGRQAFSSSERFSQSEGFPRSHDPSSIEHRNGSGSRDDSYSSEVHGGSRGSFRTGSKGGDKSLASFSSDREDCDSFFQNSDGSRGGSSTFHGGARGRGEPRDSFRSMSAVRGSQGARGASSVAARGSYHQVTMSGDAWQSFSGGQNESSASYRNTIGDHGNSQGSFTGGQGDFDDSHRDVSESRGTSRGSLMGKQDDLSDSFHNTSNGRGTSHGPFIGSQRDSRGSYRGASSGRGTFRGSLTGGRGVSRGSYRGSRGIRGGDAQRGFRGGRGQFAGFPAGNSIGRGSVADSYGGTYSGRGDVRGSFRGGRGVSSQVPRGGMTASARGTGVSRGRGLDRSASRERGGGTPRNFLREKSEGKESSISVPSEIKKGFVVVDSYKTSTLSCEDFSGLPKEALQCSVCKIISFKSTSAFKEHLESQHHAHMLTLLAARNDCLEQFIKMGAKLASRAVEHEVISNSDCEKDKPKSQESEFIMCTYCNCTVLRSALSMHNQLIQHKELMEFSKPLCCGIKFTKRQAYETHKVSSKHLTNKHQFEKLFVANAVLAIEKEVLKSKEESISKGFTVKSLSLAQSEYVIKILQLLERNPVIENDKEDFCLACEVSVPKFRRSFHPCCSDHHANTVVFCSKNKIRLTARITQYLKEVRDRAPQQQQQQQQQGAPHKAAVGQSVTGSIAASAKAATAVSSKPPTKSSTLAASSSSPSIWSSARLANKTSSPSSVKGNTSFARNPSKPLCGDKAKSEKCLVKDEENDVIDDEFDYEFSSVDIDDNKEKPGKDMTSKDPVPNKQKETPDSEEECVDDEFAYEYDASLSNSNVKPSDKMSVATIVTSEVAKEVEAPEDEDAADDFEYEYAPVAKRDSKTLDKNTSGSKNVVSHPVDRKKDEVEEKTDEFDYQVEPALTESRDRSCKKLKTAKVVMNDQADDFHYDLDGINSCAITKKDLVEDQHSSQDANDNDEEFDYEVADMNDDSTAVREDHDCNILGDNDDFEYEMKVPESREDEEEEDEDGFEYDLPPESPKEIDVSENMRGNGDDSNDESAFDYEMPNDQNVNENINDDPTASSVKNANNSTVLISKKNDSEETADVPDDNTNEVDDLVEEFDYEILKDQTADLKTAEEEVDEDEFEYQCPVNSTSEDKIEIKATSNSTETSSTEREIEEAEDITISETVKSGNEEEEEEEVTATLSLKRKRPRKISGLDKSSEVKTEPKSTAEAGTRPKRRSIAPIRFE